MGPLRRHATWCRDFDFAFGLCLRLVLGRSIGFNRIKNPIGEQFHLVTDERPDQRISPDETRPTPAERWHQESVDRDQCRHDLCPEHGHP